MQTSLFAFQKIRPDLFPGDVGSFIQHMNAFIAHGQTALVPVPGAAFPTVNTIVSDFHYLAANGVLVPYTACNFYEHISTENRYSLSATAHQEMYECIDELENCGWLREVFMDIYGRTHLSVLTAVAYDYSGCREDLGYDLYRARTRRSLVLFRPGQMPAICQLIGVNVRGTRVIQELTKFLLVLRLARMYDRQAFRPRAQPRYEFTPQFIGSPLHSRVSPYLIGAIDSDHPLYV